MNVLVIDVGGTRVKLRASDTDETRSFPSGATLTPEMFVGKVLEVTSDWRYEVIALGYPGTVDERGPAVESQQPTDRARGLLPGRMTVAISTNGAVATNGSAMRYESRVPTAIATMIQ